MRKDYEMNVLLKEYFAKHENMLVKNENNILSIHAKNISKVNIKKKKNFIINLIQKITSAFAICVALLKISTISSLKSLPLKKLTNHADPAIVLLIFSSILPLVFTNSFKSDKHF